MTRLADLPCLVVGDDPGGAGLARIRGEFPGAVAASAGKPTSGSDLVVLIEGDLDPKPGVGALSIDRALAASGQAIGFLSQNAVTGEHTARGICICRPRQVDANGKAASVDIVVPRLVGTWLCNRTPGQAFAYGFASAPGPEQVRAMAPAERSRLALYASVGSDADHGSWWSLGFLSGLLSEVDDDVARPGHLAGATLDDQLLERELAQVCRRVRLQLGLAVQILPPAESKLVRAVLSMHPERSWWLCFAEACDRLGPSGAELALASRRAALVIWGDGGPGVDLPWPGPATGR